jgi:hypothetical protein
MADPSTGLSGFSIGANFFTLAGGAANDIFASSGLKVKAEGERIEGQEYDLAASLAKQNEQFTEEATAVKEQMLQRSIYQTVSGQQADVASAGFQESGSAIDLLRDSQRQGALTQAIAGQQGLIEEAAYDEQAKSYQLMSSAANMAAEASEKAAGGAMITGIIKGIGAVASLIPGVGAVAGPLASAVSGAIAPQPPAGA